MKRFDGARTLLSSERGLAVPTMLGVLTAILAIAAVAATTSIRAQGGSVRDQNTKSALAVADTGINQALLRYNLVAPVEASPCLVAGPGGVMTQTGPQADGWCAPVSGSSGGDTYVYRTRHVAGETLEVVSTGTADGITRRVELTGSASTGRNVFREAGAIGRDSIVLDSNATIHANLGTNGDILLNSNAEICGNAQHGIGRQLILEGNSTHEGVGCIGAGTEGEGLVTLPPVSQGDAPTNNSNGRFWAPNCVDPDPQCDTKTGGNSASWDASTRSLTLDHNSTATLGGSKPYSFCRLRILSNATLFIAAEATVRIFFDSPEECNLPAGTAQLEMDSNTRIIATSGVAESAQFLFVGSDTISTRIQLNSNSEASGAGCEHTFVIYAPRTDIDINSNSTYCGLIAGKSLHLDSNAEVIQSPNADQWVLPGAAPHYVLDRYTECTGAAGTPPDASC